MSASDVQLYVITSGPPAPRAVPAEAALRAAAAAFPVLDDGRLERGTTARGNVEFAFVSHPPAVAAPRRYAGRRGSELVLYDGLPIDRLDRFAATDADELLRRWDDLPDALEGIFSAVRIDLAGGAVDCLPDVLGISHVYVHERPGAWVLGNSLEAVAAAAGLDAPDPVGAASLLTLGWAACGTTIIRGIRQLAGGHVHEFRPGGRRARPTFTPAMAAPRRQPAQHVDAAGIARALTTTTRAAARGIEPLVCGVTAGRDTRVLMALARAAGWDDATYYTSGVEEDVDVRFARELTGRLGLPFELVTPPFPETDDELVASTARFVSQTDGLATVAVIDDWIDHQRPVERLGLKLWGPGGEIGRAGNIGLAIPFVANTWGLRWSPGPQRWVLRHKARRWDLFRPEALDATRAALDGFAQERLDEGWRPREVLEAYYGFERVAHWASCGVRRASGATDLYSPFISRDYIRYCFSLSSGERVVEAPHWRILSELAPDLRDMAFEHAWRPQKPRAAQAMVLRDVTRYGVSTARRRLPARPAVAAPKRRKYGAQWLEDGRAAHRDLCLSHPDSPLWELVDRRSLETALRTPIDELPHPRYWISVCNAVTAFWWFHGRAAAPAAQATVRAA